LVLCLRQICDILLIKMILLINGPNLDNDIVWFQSFENQTNYFHYLIVKFVIVMEFSIMNCEWSD